MKRSAGRIRRVHNLLAVVASFGWFAVGYFVDYGLGYFPAIPEEFIPLTAMLWSTIAVTVGLSGLFLWLALRARSGPEFDPDSVSEGKQGASQFV